MQALSMTVLAENVKALLHVFFGGLLVADAKRQVFLHHDQES
jgi:hypothetical protein